MLPSLAGRSDERRLGVHEHGPRPARGSGTGSTPGSDGGGQSMVSGASTDDVLGRQAPAGTVGGSHEAPAVAARTCRLADLRAIRLQILHGHGRGCSSPVRGPSTVVAGASGSPASAGCRRSPRWRAGRPPVRRRRAPSTLVGRVDCGAGVEQRVRCRAARARPRNPRPDDAPPGAPTATLASSPDGHAVDTGSTVTYQDRDSGPPARRRARRRRPRRPPRPRRGRWDERRPRRRGQGRSGASRPARRRSERPRARRRT